MSNGDLDPLYKDRPITLWVEDGLTRDYLAAVWDDPKQIRLLIAGDSSSVAALVKSARQADYGFVFGVCDRDFGKTNYGSWSKTTSIFRLQMHEIENALLDPPSLHAALEILGRARSEDQLRKRLAEEAAGACWGMALGSTLAWIRTLVQQEFPPANGLVEVRDRAAALHCILGSKWWMELLPSIPTTLTRESVNQQLDHFFAAYSADLVSGDFVTTFAGKELLGRCQSWLLQKGKGPHPTESDLAKAVGAAQRSAGNVPAEISSLLATLLSTL